MIDFEIAADVTDKYHWPKFLIGRRCFDSSIKTIIDLGQLKNILSGFDLSKPVIITILSKEYLEIAKLWLSNITRTNHPQFLLFVTDTETTSFLTDQGFQSHTVPLAISENTGPNFISEIGFDNKGLLITSAKFPIIKYIIEQGFHVIFSDIDAMFLKSVPFTDLSEADIAFQRVIYHPAFISDKWGFAICTGFLFFKSSSSVVKILEDAIKFHTQVYCDQLALNLAIAMNKPIWGLALGLDSNQDKRSHFVVNAGKSIFGKIESLNLCLKALSASAYYRNDLVKLEWNKVILFHPNSPKNGLEKIKIFEKFNPV